MATNEPPLNRGDSPGTPREAPAPSPDRVAPRRGVLLRFLLFLGVLVVGLVTVRMTPVSQYVTEEWLTATLHELRASRWAPVGLVALYVVLCPIGMPATPLMITGGAVFGVVKGTVVNFSGAFLAAVVSFWFARGLGHDLVAHLLGRRLKQIEGFLQKHGFWTLVRLRFVPVPFAVANFGAALLGVRFWVFLAATALGLAPTMLVFSYFASAVVTAAEGERSGVFRNLFFAVCLLLALTFVPTLWRAWNRRRQPPRSSGSRQR